MRRIRGTIAAISLAMASVVAIGVIGSTQERQPVSAANIPGATEYFPSAAPYRVFDSQVGAGSTTYVTVANVSSYGQGQCYEAAELNVTVASSSAANYLVVWGTGNKPNTSFVNAGPGEAVANAGAIPTYWVSTGGGRVRMRVYSKTNARVIVDMHGVYLSC